MKIEFSCASCMDALNVADTSEPYTVDGETTIMIEIDPCPCCQNQTPEEGDPIRLPYLTLVRILQKKVVTVLYRKKNGDLRELTGFLGLNDLRYIDSDLHYFHELDENGVDSEMGGVAKTNCKVLNINRIYSVEHFDSISGIHKQSYIVDESEVA
jgi:hypothetical protein